MESLFFLIPLAVLFSALGVGAFFWAVNNRQFDDLDNAARRILFDDEPSPPEPEQEAEQRDDA